MTASNTPTSTGPNAIRILHLEDSDLDHELVLRALLRIGMADAVRRVERLPDFVAAVSEPQAWDVVLGDYRLEGFTALDAWQVLRAQASPPPFILVSGAIGEAAVVEAIQQGIADFVHKDELGRLERVIRRALDARHDRLAREAAQRALERSERRITELVHYLQQAIEHERAAIARDIHDDIGGALTAANMDLSWIARHPHDVPQAQAHAQAAVEMVQHALGASQRIMMNLRPSILDQGLLAAVDWLVSGFERRTGIPVKVQAHGQMLGVRPDIQLVAFRLVQEGLTNIAKYARCTAVSVEMSDAQQVLTVEVRDNGCGMSAEAPDMGTGFGLRGLQERAKTVGGWLDISTGAGRGTALVLSVPLTPQSQALAEELSE